MAPDLGACCPQLLLSPHTTAHYGCVLCVCEQLPDYWSLTASLCGYLHRVGEVFERLEALEEQDKQQPNAAQSDTTGAQDAISVNSKRTGVNTGAGHVWVELRLHDLTVAVSHRPLLEGVSFSLANGDGSDFLNAPPALLIRGPSGSGKTSLLRSLLGLQEAVGTPTDRGGLVTFSMSAAPSTAEGDSDSSGAVHARRDSDGRWVLDAADAPGTWLAGRPLVTCLPQHPYIFDGSLLELLMYPTRPPASPSPALRCRIRELCELVELADLAAMIDDEADPMLKALLHPQPRFVTSTQIAPTDVDAKDPHVRGWMWDASVAWNDVLSAGEQQRVAFVRLLFQRPWFVLLDEATSSLPARMQRKLYGLARQDGIAVLSCGHDDGLAELHDDVYTTDPVSKSLCKFIV